jgi:hypothetical protein
VRTYAGRLRIVAFGTLAIWHVPRFPFWFAVSAAFDRLLGRFRFFLGFVG